MTASSFGRSVDSFETSLARALRNVWILGDGGIVETDRLEVGEQRIGIGDRAFETVDHLQEKSERWRRRAASVNQPPITRLGSPQLRKTIREAPQTYQPAHVNVPLVPPLYTSGFLKLAPA